MIRCEGRDRAVVCPRAAEAGERSRRYSGYGLGNLLGPVCVQSRHKASHSLRRAAAFCRGRDAGYPTPPAQIRTCRIAAYGSGSGSIAKTMLETSAKLYGFQHRPYYGALPAGAERRSCADQYLPENHAKMNFAMEPARAYQKLRPAVPSE